MNWIGMHEDGVQGCCCVVVVWLLCCFWYAILSRSNLVYKVKIKPDFPKLFSRYFSQLYRRNESLIIASNLFSLIVLLSSKQKVLRNVRLCGQRNLSIMSLKAWINQSHRLMSHRYSEASQSKKTVNKRNLWKLQKNFSIVHWVSIEVKLNKSWKLALKSLRKILKKLRITCCLSWSSKS